ncbi:MAG: hypothetical protein JWM14_3012 [Chitinophagaceae bacterium]|nr:hypothetical protein [Chitinophagaceae bacterium]
MTYKLIFAPVIFLLLFSCSGPKVDYVAKVKVLHLTDGTLYDKALVYDVIFDSEESDVDSLKNKSRTLFLSGIDEYKNKKNIRKAIDLFKESILVFPDAKTYYELGNALLDFNRIDLAKEALEAYEVADHLDFQPKFNINYKEACANNLLYNTAVTEEKENYLYETLASLRNAFYNGFIDTLQLKNDSRINSIMLHPDYREILLDAQIARGKDSPNTLFELFKNAFPSSQTKAFEIDKSNVEMNNYDQSISYDFASFIPEMENTGFGREVSRDYFYVAKVAETPAYTALVYRSMSFYGNDMQPVYATLVTFDPEGEIIAKKIIACQCSAEKIKEAKIENNIITIHDYKRKWEQPIGKIDFKDNKIVDYELQAKVVYKIEDTGKITDQDVPSNYNDSTVAAK